MSFNSEDLIFRVGAKFDLKPEQLQKQLEGVLNQIKSTHSLTLDTSEANKGINGILKKIGILKNELENISKTGAFIVAPEFKAPTQKPSLKGGRENELPKLRGLTEEERKRREEQERQVQLSEKELGNLNALLIKSRERNATVNRDYVTTDDLKTFAKENEHLNQRSIIYQKLEEFQKGKIALTEEEYTEAKKLLPVYDQLYEKAIKNKFAVSSTGKTAIHDTNKANQTELYGELSRATKLRGEIERAMQGLNINQHAKEYSLLAKEFKKINDEISQINKEIESKKLKSTSFEKQIKGLTTKSDFSSTKSAAKQMDLQKEAVQKAKKEIEQLNEEFKRFIINNKSISSEEIDKLQRGIRKLSDSTQKAGDNIKKNIGQDTSLEQMNKQIKDNNNALSHSAKDLDKLNKKLNNFKSANKIKVRVDIEENKLNNTINKLQTKISSLETKKVKMKFVEEAEVDKIISKIKTLESEAKKVNFNNLSPKKLNSVSKETERIEKGFREATQEMNRLIEAEAKLNANFKLDNQIDSVSTKIQNMVNVIENKLGNVQLRIDTKGVENVADYGNIKTQYEEILQKAKQLSSQEIVDQASVDNALQTLKEMGAELGNVNTKFNSVKAGNQLSDEMNKMSVRAKDLKTNIDKSIESLKRMKMQYPQLTGEIDKQITKYEALKSQIKSTSDITKTGFNLNEANKHLQKYKDTMSDLNGVTNSLRTEGQALGNVFGSVFDLSKITSFVAQFYLIKTAIRNIYEEVALLDSTITTLKITMDSNEKAYMGLIDGATELAKESGAELDKVLGIVKTYANASESASQVMSKIKPTLALANLSGSDADTAVNNIQAIMEQFKLIEEASGDVEKATYRVTDSVVAISKQLKMDFAQGIQTISEGIMTAGSVIKEAGMDMERYSSIVAAVAEETRMSGS